MSTFGQLKENIYKYIYGSKKITDNYFFVIFFVLKIIGCNIFTENWRLNLIGIYHVSSTACFWSIVLLNFCRKVFGPIGFEFPNDMSYTYIWAGLSGGGYATIVIIVNRKALREVYDCVFIEFQEWFTPDKAKLAKYKKRAKRLLNWSIFAGVQILSASFLIIFRPLTDSSTLPMYDEPSKVPGLNYTAFVHDFMFAMQTTTVLTLTGILFSSDAIFFVTSTHLSAQLFMLGEELEEAGFSGDNIKIENTLKTFVIRHNAIQRCLQRLSYAYKPQSFAIPFMALVFTTFSLLAFDGSISTGPSIGMGAAHIFHLLNFCLPAQTVIQESEHLFLRVMHSNWQSWPLKHQKSLLIIMQRLKKPMGVECGISSVFSFKLLGSTIQTIYSLYNTARRLEK